MKDKLLIATKIRKTNDYIFNVVSNFPHKELALKNRIIETCFDSLELVYLANVSKGNMRNDYQRKLIVKLRMIDYYTKISCHKKILGLKKYQTVGNFLLETESMIQGWMKYEVS